MGDAYPLDGDCGNEGSARPHACRARLLPRLSRQAARGLGRALGMSAIGMFLLVSSSRGQNVIAYPAQGQSADQQSRDRYECHLWAIQQSGFDPTQPQPAPPPSYAPPPAGQQAGVLPGAARGAAVGAVGGAIGGDAGKGAAIGAATGALLGGIRRNQQQAQQQAYQRQVQSGSSSPQRATYNRALQTCLQGRGYAVN